MFASTALAARVDRAEGALMAEATRAIAVVMPDVDTFVHEFAGGYATVAGPSSPMTKVIGIGFEGSIDDAEWRTIETEHNRRGVPVQIELSTLADQSVAPTLTARGYRLVGFENVNGAELQRVGHTTPRTEAIRVLPSGNDALESYIDLIVTGFMHPDTQGVVAHDAEHEYPRELLEQSVRDIMRAEGFRRYVAQLDGVAAGAASMRIKEGVALLCGAATLPHLRRRGVQTALTQHRLRDAADLGCDIAVVVTQPGSKSAQNSHRQGFDLLYPRAVLVKTFD